MSSNVCPVVDASMALVNLNKIEKACLTQEQVPCPVIHRFGPGVYIREVHMPANTFAIGHHQNFEQMNIFLKGRVTILNDDGTTSELTAPMMFVGKPGRKIGYVHEDVVWLNVYSTDEKDVEKLESHFLTKSDEWVEAYADEKIKLLTSDANKRDFDKMLSELGWTDADVRKMSENESDMTELPFGDYKIKVSQSPIDGRGLFATGNFQSNEIIAPARIDGKRTIAGRYTNHSITPNAKMVRGIGDDILLVSTRVITGCRGGMDGEEITIDYRESYNLTMQIKLEGEQCQE